MISLKTLLSELQYTPTPTATPTYDIDGEIEKVIFTYNDATNQGLKGGVSVLNPNDWEFNRHGEIISQTNGGYSTQIAIDRDDRARKIVGDAMYRIGWDAVLIDGQLQFRPID